MIGTCEELIRMRKDMELHLQILDRGQRLPGNHSLLIADVVLFGMHSLIDREQVRQPFRFKFI